MDQQTSNHIRFGGDWYGWRMAGKDLVSPEGTRISPTRMKGIVWRIESEARLAQAAARNTARKAVRQADVKVLIVPNEDWHRRHFGTSAG